MTSAARLLAVALPALLPAGAGLAQTTAPADPVDDDPGLVPADPTTWATRDNPDPAADCHDDRDPADVAPPLPPTFPALFTRVLALDGHVSVAAPRRLVLSSIDVDAPARFAAFTKGEVAVKIVASTKLVTATGRRVAATAIDAGDDVVVRGTFAPRAQWSRPGEEYVTPQFVARRIVVRG